MDIHFQDRIDDYLLGRMDEADKEAFLQEVGQDSEKKEQLEFTRNVKEAVCSREEKLRALTELQRQYENEHHAVASACPAMRPTGTDDMCYSPAPKMKETAIQSKKKIWLWISSVAAVLVVGFFAIKPMFEYDSSPNYNGAPMENMRGGDEVFSPSPADSTDNDTVKFNIDKTVTPDE